MTDQRGQDHQVQIFRNGSPYRTWNAISADYGLDDNKERRKRLGTTAKPSRQTVDGHSGTIVFEAEGPAIDDLEYDLILARLESRDYKIEIVRTDYYPKTGERRVWAYPGAVFSISSSVPGQDDIVRITMTWQSEVKRRVA